MTPPRLFFRPLAVALLFSASAFGADTPTQSVDAGGLTFDAPAAWKSSAASGMRRAVLTVPAEKEGGVSAELIVFGFNGGGGGVDANIERWRKTFKGPDGETPKADVMVVKGKNVDVTRVELAGFYHPTAFPGRPTPPDIPDAKLLGAIVMTDQTGYFIRLVGPEKLIKAATADFDKIIASIKTN